MAEHLRTFGYPEAREEVPFEALEGFVVLQIALRVYSLSIWVFGILSIVLCLLCHICARSDAS